MVVDFSFFPKISLPKWLWWNIIVATLCLLHGIVVVVVVTFIGHIPYNQLRRCRYRHWRNFSVSATFILVVFFVLRRDTHCQFIQKFTHIFCRWLDRAHSSINIFVYMLPIEMTAFEIPQTPTLILVVKIDNTASFETSIRRAAILSMLL